MKRMFIVLVLILTIAPAAGAETLLRWPLDAHYGYTSWFDHDPLVGYMRRYDGATNQPRDEHRGTDIVGNGGTTSIRNAATGTVYYYKGDCPNTPDPGCGNGFGNNVRVEYATGKVTIYAHLQPFVIAWPNPLYCSSFLWYMGNSGNSRGTHLHLEKWTNRFASNRFDPFGGPWSNGGFSYWVNQNGAGTGNPSTQCQ